MGTSAVAIKTEKDRAEAEEQSIRADFASDDLTEKNRAEAQEAAIRSEFAADDLTEKNRAEAQEAAIRSEFAADDLTEKNRAEAQEAAIRSEFAADDLTEKNRAEAQEAAIRSEFASADAIIVGGASEAYDNLQKIEDIVVAESSAVDGDFVLDRARLLLLEGTYSNSQVDSEIDTKVAAVVDSAPSVLSTLNALAAALDDDVAFSTSVSDSIGLKRDKTDSYDRTEIDDKDDLRVLQTAYDTKTRRAGRGTNSSSNNFGG